MVLCEDMFFFIDLVDDRDGFVVLGVVLLLEKGYFFSELGIFLLIKQDWVDINTFAGKILFHGHF